MSIQHLAVGVDLVLVADVARSVEQFGDRYLDRVYTPAERGDTADSPSGLAARFAAKEAVFKAIGATDAAVAWSDIEIGRRPGGAPEVVLRAEARRLADEAGIGHWAVSMTHEGAMAAAVAVACKDARAGRPAEEER
ncbi:MAG TPA: holo-ACP synthase [Acidimicrobiales bacterium]|nr:holo-ACP synthase [Acidimicrobiales bacterium]